MPRTTESLEPPATRRTARYQRRPVIWAVLLTVSLLSSVGVVSGAASGAVPADPGTSTGAPGVETGVDSGGDSGVEPGVEPGVDPGPTTQRRKRPDFRVASFNLLGHDHTRGGKKGKRFADGRTRMNHAVKLIKRNKLGVVGFQEFQKEQRQRFMKLTGKTWAHYPGAKLNFTEMHNSIAWRTKRWKLVDANTIKIPYFRGKLQRMPYLLLKHRPSGRKVWFANFHNPADSRGNAQKWRTQAMKRQAKLAVRLAKTGRPVIFTGDMNEREEYFCGFTKRAPMMKAAQGGQYTKGRKCRPPKRPTKRPGIDWIFGSKNVRFDNYQRRTGRLVSKITDHPVIFVDVEFKKKKKKKRRR